MKTNLFKNILLVWSGIILATSFAIYAMPPIQWTSIQANLTNLVQYLRELHITSDGTPNGDSILSVNGSGEFVQSRWSDLLVNTDSLDWSYPFVWATSSSGTTSMLAWVLAWQVGALAYQDTDWSWKSSYIMAQSDRAMLWFNADLTQQTDAVNEIQVLDYGVVFRFPQAEYTFPMDAGSPGQVLTTNGSNELSWADAGWSSNSTVLSTGIFVSSDELLNMWVNPIELIPSPGEGKYIQPIAVSIKFSPWLTPYDFGWHLVVFEWWSSVNYLYNFTADLSTTESFIVNGWYNISTIAKLGEDEALKLSSIENSSPTGWDGVLEVFITYRIVTASTGV